MQIDFKTLQLVTLAGLFALLYAGRMVKGSSRQTPDGLAFPLKPIVVWSRAALLPVYGLLFFWPMHQTMHRPPLLLILLIVGLALLLLSQMPGTIVLTPTGIEQRFWLRKLKAMSYHEVMSIQMVGAGRMVRVMGDNRVSITHTWNHSASAEFIAELERRTGKRAIR
jgi:hypothetical protein